MQPEKIYSAIAKITPLYDIGLTVTGYKKSVDHFISHLPFEKTDEITALDAGCGTGLYSLALLKRFPQSHVAAFDYNTNLVARLKTKIAKEKLSGRTHLFTADLREPLAALPFAEFNLIITSGILEHVPLAQTVENLSRLLAPGGYFFNSPVRNTPWGRSICKLYGARPYPRAENLRAFESQGFVLQKIIELPRHLPASFKEAHIFKKTQK